MPWSILEFRQLRVMGDQIIRYFLRFAHYGTAQEYRCKIEVTKVPDELCARLREAFEARTDATALKREIEVLLTNDDDDPFSRMLLAQDRVSRLMIIINSSETLEELRERVKQYFAVKLSTGDVIYQ
jgi:hypothetical protein